MKSSIKVYLLLLSMVGAIFISTKEIFSGENDFPISLQDLPMQEIQTGLSSMSLGENADTASDRDNKNREDDNNTFRKYTEEQSHTIKLIRNYLDEYEKNKQDTFSTSLMALIIKTMDNDIGIFDIEDLYRISQLRCCSTEEERIFCRDMLQSRSSINIFKKKNKSLSSKLINSVT